MAAVYALCDPRKPTAALFVGPHFFEYEPFYIGKTVRPVKQRLQEHFSGADGYGSAKWITICDIIQETENLPLVQILYDNIPETKALKLERKFIECLGRENLSTGILTNATDGGEGVSGRIMSDAEKFSRGISISNAKQRQKRDDPVGFKRIYEVIGENIRNRSPEAKEISRKKWARTISSKSPLEIKQWHQKISKAITTHMASYPAGEGQRRAKKGVETLKSQGRFEDLCKRRHDSNKERTFNRYLELLTPLKHCFKYVSGYEYSHSKCLYRCKFHGSLELRADVVRRNVLDNLSSCPSCRKGNSL